ncbi:MAG: hypothetical protein NTV89_17375 [Proteobacteria bacterium]|nr:hypothetical protein [Pseudomonadota bacterium]
MSATRKIIMYGTALAAALSLVFCIISIFRYQNLSEREQLSRTFQQELEAADAVADDAAAAAAYQKLRSPLPEVQLRILQRQWRAALALLKSVQMCRYNASLEQEVSAYNARLKEHLDAMLDRCSSTLSGSGTVRPEVVWQLYNVSGSAKLLKAFVILENEKNADKVQGVIRDALSDYKSAINAVDNTGAATLEKNIPRWNFELLNSEQYIKKIEAIRTDSEVTQALKENLETLIPELGGYAPGEPIETKIKK